MLRYEARQPRPAVLQRVTSQVYRLERHRRRNLLAELRRLLRFRSRS
jgi:hypothetical protein